VCKNNCGFTLIEFLVSLVILMVGMLGLLQTINFALQYNLSNQLRNDAVSVGDTQMNMELAKPFDLISTVTSSKLVSRQILNGFKNYSVTRSGQDMTNSKQVTIEVRWKYKSQLFSHTVFGASSKSNK